ncbi:MAG: PIG-L family deacetylase [Actinobacteria bacterium]|nr:PIG-L family deacetylase [Actinomycetota bacterium]
MSFHAHPDDEVLLTGGTLARLAEAGHRVVLVTATSGAAGLADSGSSGGQTDAAQLGAVRLAELERSAAALGCARVVHLGYRDSGWSAVGAPDLAPDSFARVPLDRAADALAEILREENADILTAYDRNGGYGHLDHVKVHDVALAAAERAATRRVLLATVDRRVIGRAVRVLQTLRLLPAGTAADRVGSWFCDRAEITHRIRVRAVADRKRAALACHVSQAGGGEGPRTAALLLRLPRPVFRLVCGTEWFVESGALVPPRPLADPLEPAAPAGPRLQLVAVDR